MKPVREQVLMAIRQHRLIPAGAVIVAAVSGGADSLALLHLLAALRQKLRFRLQAATFDHGLRGEESAEDARHVVALARAWDVPVTAGRADEIDLPREGAGGIEQWARMARYRFLARVMGEVGADRVATGHQLDDQAETVLMRLLRGGGEIGLAGMAYVAPMPEAPDRTVIRPLLGVRRAEIEAYCQAHGIQPRHDSSNDDPALLRNRIRHEILPLLRQINPQVERALAQTGEVAALNDAFLWDALAEFMTRVEQGGAMIRVERAAYRRLHPALQRRFMLWAARRLADEETLGYVHIVQAAALAAQGRTGAAALLPGKIVVRVERTQITLESRKHEDGG